METQDFLNWLKTDKHEIIKDLREVAMAALETKRDYLMHPCSTVAMLVRAIEKFSPPDSEKKPNIDPCDGAAGSSSGS